MNAFQAGLEQKAQGSGAAAFLQGFPPAVLTCDLPFQACLLLLEPSAGALLNGDRLRQLLQPFLAAADRIEQGLPFLVELFLQRLHSAVLSAVLVPFQLQIMFAFLALTQPLHQLLTLRLQRGEGGLQLLPAAAALPLLLHPGARATGHFSQATARELHSPFRAAALLLSSVKRRRVGAEPKGFGFGLNLPPASLQVMAQGLQSFALLLVLRGLPFQLAALRIKACQLRLNPE